jgi:esterase/lipase superfamily enzyme
MVLKCETQDRTAFFADVKTTVERSIGREAFVFVHGYNVSFEDAARRTAQIAYDLKFAGAAILFSWPSKAKFKTYVADETNVRWTVPQLRTFLEDLATQAGADTIHLIAHSMGNRALTDVLEQLAIAGTVKMPAFRQIVLAAPDIDADVFRKLVTVIKATGERMTLYSCAKDKALEASRRFHGYPRAGDSIIIVRGVDTIDASAVDTSLLGHSYFGNNRTVLTDIFALLNDGDPPEDRFGMTPRQLTGGTYYAFAP